MTPLTRQQKIEALTEVMVTAVPEIMEKCGCGECDYCELVPEGEPRDINLEDVLRYLKKSKWKNESGVFADVLDYWTLGKSLDQQSDATIDFLFDLLPSH